LHGEVMVVAGLMVMGNPILFKQDPGRLGIDFGAIAAQAGVREGIITHPEASMRDLQVD